MHVWVTGWTSFIQFLVCISNAKTKEGRAAQAELNGCCYCTFVRVFIWWRTSLCGGFSCTHWRSSRAPSQCGVKPYFMWLVAVPTVQQEVDVEQAHRIESAMRNLYADMTTHVPGQQAHLICLFFSLDFRFCRPKGREFAPPRQSSE